MPTEVGHLGASVYWWHSFANDVYCVNPPLTRIVSGLPVVLARPKYSEQGYSPKSYDRPEWEMGRAFLDLNSPSKKRWCLTLARWSLIPFVLLGGYFGYRLSLEIYGDLSAIIFLVLWCFSPLILAWGATICPDVTATSLGLVATYMFRRWLRTPGWQYAFVAGISLGLLTLTKLTWIIAFFLWPLIWMFWISSIHVKNLSSSKTRPPFRQLIAILFVGLYMLNLGYFFEGSLQPVGNYEFVSQLLSCQSLAEGEEKTITANRFANTWLASIPIPLPSAYVQGIDIQRYDFEQGKWSYLRGEWRQSGWWYYYLYALAIKVPLGVWLLFAVTFTCTFFSQKFTVDWRDEFIIFLPMIAILTLVSSQSGISAHPRYVLPALPFVFLWTSKIARTLQSSAHDMKQIALKSFVLFILTWTVISSLWIYPHSLSYCNELMSGPQNGPKHLLGSSNDWGQDLFYLEDWCIHHPDARPMYVAYRGGYRLKSTKIASAGLPQIRTSDHASSETANLSNYGLKRGWYALSANDIYGRDKEYSHFQHLQPTAMAGYSIYIYEITSEK